MERVENVFNILFLVGRPAAGKSEIIDYLKRLPAEERARRMAVKEFEEIDDFPMIWSWFEEDDILSRRGKERLHSDENGYFLDNDLWNVLIERLELEYWKREEEESLFGKNKTAVIEFARGAEHGGFDNAFRQFTPSLLERAAVLYIDVPFEESLKKNRKRKNPNKPHSILEHSLEDEKVHYLYKEVDWEKITANNPQYLEYSSVRVPYAVFENADDVTTGAGTNPLLGSRLEETLQKLWNRYKERDSCID